jgi:DNA polymerase-1
MLESYLLNPTHASHTLIDIAARSTSLALLHQPTKDNPNDPKRLAEAAAAVVRLAKTLGEQLVESETARPSEILPDEPGLGGAMTEEMLFAEPVTKAGSRKQEAGSRKSAGAG